MNFFKKALSPTLAFLVCIALCACSADVPMELPSSGTTQKITATTTEGSTITATTITEEMSTTAFEIETTVMTSTKAPTQTSFSSMVQTTSTTVAPTTTNTTVPLTEASRVEPSSDRYPPEDKRQFSVYFSGEIVSLTFSEVTTDRFPLEYAYWNYTGTLSTGQTVSCRVVNTTECITHIGANYAVDSGFLKEEEARAFLLKEFQTMGFAVADEDITNVGFSNSGSTQNRAIAASASVSIGEGEYFWVGVFKSGGQLRLSHLTVVTSSVECNKYAHAYLTPAWA